MGTYQISITREARRSLSRLPDLIRIRLAARIDELATVPRPPDAKLLKGDSERRWRVRVGHYRIIYRIEDARLVVTVVKVGHRREIYR